MSGNSGKPQARQRGRLHWIGVWATGLTALSSASVAQATAPSPAAVEAQKVWGAILSRCGESYFYVGSVFDRSGMLSNVQMGGHQGTLEYKGVRFNTVPIRETDAERANGVAYSARISMIAHLYREADGDWQDGPDLRPRNVDDMIGQAIGQANSDMFDMGSAGAIALELVKFKGTWSVARSSTTSTSSLAFMQNFYDVDKLIATQRYRYDCAKRDLVPTAFQKAEDEAAERKRLADLAVADARMAQFKADQERRRRAREEGLAQWSYKGPVAGFSTALVRNLIARAKEWGVEPTQYQPEVDLIMQVVAKCTQITKADFDTYMRTSDRETPEMERVEECDDTHYNKGQFGFTVSPGSRARGIEVDTKLREQTSESDWNFTGNLTLDVYFDRLDGDKDPGEAVDPTYIIISAKLPFNSSAPTNTAQN